MIWTVRVLLVWLGGGAMAFLAALLIDVWRDEEVGVRYVLLHRRAVALLLLAWPWALVLVLNEYRRAGGLGE